MRLLIVITLLSIMAASVIVAYRAYHFDYRIEHSQITIQGVGTWTEHNCNR